MRIHEPRCCLRCCCDRWVENSIRHGADSASSIVDVYVQPWFHGEYKIVMKDGETINWSGRYVTGGFSVANSDLNYQTAELRVPITGEDARHLTISQVPGNQLAQHVAKIGGEVQVAILV